MPAHIKYTEDMVRGKRFGKPTGLTIFKKPRIEKGVNSWYRYAVCVCECGNVCQPQLTSLMSGKTKSCGCGLKEWQDEFNTKWTGDNAYRRHKEKMNEL
ncbi:TPA: hypothetical protein GM645_00075 [Klebsiella pneumoniae]|nr:hypothetical protein [Klebsiella pneumoniae]HBX0707464.1 hypothetical protein [Klebsiella pneumoniae]HCB0969503.1 hypothetical protein [Klebsiella pneumoniae]HCB1251205.1 hypothetical protein [Klebsiella pneumoniae]